MPSTICLTPGQIAAFHHGSLPLEDHFRVAEHITGCKVCESQSAFFGSSLPGGPTLRPLAGAVTIHGEDDTLREAVRVPERIGPYYILKLIGRGGMGAVYEARHTKLDRIVALKILPSPMTVDREYQERFDREARAIARLNHPNVVRATDAGEVDGYPFLALELLDGVDVGRLIGSLGTVPLPEVAEIGQQVAWGLAHLHEQNIIHRDVKPSNLMLTTAGVVKILDLGLALTTEALGVPSGRLTGITFLGTHDYMAPEQWIDPTVVDAKVDIYGLGCVMFQMVSGHVPFGTPTMSPRAKMKAHLEMPIPSIEEGTPELAGLLQRMLAKDPNDRPTAATVAAELEPLRGGAHLSRLLEQSRLAPRTGFADGAPTNEAPLCPEATGFQSLAPSPPTPQARGDEFPRGTPQRWFGLGAATTLMITAIAWAISRWFGYSP